MNLIILHGNNLAAISSKLSKIKAEFDPNSIVELNSKELSFDQALVEISTPVLFASKRLMILEDFEKDLDLEKLSKDQDLKLVLKFNKNLVANSSILKNAAKLKAQVINLAQEGEANIFPFIDLLADKNPKAWEQIDWRLEEHGGQYILTMIFYMLRRMVQSPKSLPPFVVKKIEQQRKNFPLEKISQIYEAALSTDFKIKSGLVNEKLGITLLVSKIIN